MTRKYKIVITKQVEKFIKKQDEEYKIILIDIGNRGQIYNKY